MRNDLIEDRLLLTAKPRVIIMRTRSKCIAEMAVMQKDAGIDDAMSILAVNKCD